MEGNIWRGIEKEQGVQGVERRIREKVMEGKEGNVKRVRNEGR